MWLPIQDILAPFFRFMRAKYESRVQIPQDSMSDAHAATIEVSTSLVFPWTRRSLFVGSIQLSRDQAGAAVISDIDMQYLGGHIRLTRL
jgi:hypothetical protein